MKIYDFFPPLVKNIYFPNYLLFISNGFINITIKYIIIIGIDITDITTTLDILKHSDVIYIFSSTTSKSYIILLPLTNNICVLNP